MCIRDSTHTCAHTQIDKLQAKLSGFLPSVADFKATVEEVNQRGEREAKQNEELLRQTAKKLEQEKKAKEKEEEEERKREQEKATAAAATKATDTASTKLTTDGSSDGGGGVNKESETTECKLFPKMYKAYMYMCV